jgi:hypothetical protein
VGPLDETRSRFTEHVRGEPGGFFRIAEPILHRLVRRSIRRDFPRLKALLERGAELGATGLRAGGGA